MELVFPPPPPAPEQPPSTSLPLPHRDAYPDEPREYARALMQRKDEIEKEIEAIKDVLTSHGSTPNTSLVDPEGYPRGDIDIASRLSLTSRPGQANPTSPIQYLVKYAIRHARSALVRLQNDRQTVSDLLATALEDAFSVPSSSTSASNFPSSGQPNGRIPPDSSSLARGTGLGSGSTTTTTGVNGDAREAVVAWPERAIARVNSVAPSSPASQAGLRAEDLIYDFAGVNHTTSGGIQAIGGLVNRSEGTSLTLLVLRPTPSEPERITLHLIPRSGWGGRGMLGCHILPV
ncbi:hypothetical protein IAT40_006062 [Kwoniella sp. CBS 6097]